MNTDMGRHEAADGLPSEELFRPVGGGSSAWKRRTALAGLVGAPASAALGAGALFGGYLLGVNELGSILTAAGKVLVLAIIPMLLVGATALDWLEDSLVARERGGTIPRGLGKRPEDSNGCRFR